MKIHLGPNFSVRECSNQKKINVGFVKAIFNKPASAARSSFIKYREAIRLHIKAFWKRYALVFVGAAALIVCILLWRIMFGIASTFVELSEGLAKYEFLALASAIVAFVEDAEREIQDAKRKHWEEMERLEKGNS